MKNKVVVETPAGICKLLINPSESDLSNLDRVGCKYLINPSLNAVKRLPPEMWKIVEDLVLPLSGEEQQKLQKMKDYDAFSALTQGFRSQADRRAAVRWAVRMASIKWVLLGTLIGSLITMGVLKLWH